MDTENQIVHLAELDIDEKSLTYKICSWRYSGWRGISVLDNLQIILKE
jgi:hypothetical protein